MKLKKKTIMLASLITGVVMLTTSAFANYVNSSGYEDCKRAVKRLLKEDNYTIELSVDGYIDDTYWEGMKITQLLDTDGDVKLNYFLSDSIDYSTKEYFQDGESISVRTTRNPPNNLKGLPEIDESYYINDVDPQLTYLFKVDENDQKTFDKAVRFVELLADMIVGDLKNNMILIDSDDTGDTYAVDLEGYQMPELISAGLSLVGSANSNTFYNTDRLNEMTVIELADYDLMLLLGEEPVVDNAKIQAKLDNEGRIINLTSEVTVSGYDYNNNPHSFRMTFSGIVSDYDTTIPERIDLTGKSVTRESERSKKIVYIEEDETISEPAVDEMPTETEINTDENSSSAVTSFPEATSSSSVVIIN